MSNAMDFPRSISRRVEVKPVWHSRYAVVNNHPQERGIRATLPRARWSPSGKLKSLLREPR